MTESTTFACSQCGSELKFEPGIEALECTHCGHQNAIEGSEEVIEELDFEAALEQAAEGETLREALVVRCDSCGAQVELPENVTASECSYCGDTLVAQKKSERRFKPKSLLPFRVPAESAKDAFKRWITSRWFAPNALKQQHRQDRLNGLYIPYWTYDYEADSRYTGARGEHYWVSQTYTVNGKTQTRMVQKTRWYPASGQVHNEFDDVLVLASRALPGKTARKLEPWDLHELAPFQEEYLSGFVVEAYTMELPDGFVVAQARTLGNIIATIKRDIGGDVQTIRTRQTEYSEITFKHILLPLWISSYRYKGKVYRFFVNARTGQIQGERPISWVKIVLLILSVLAVGGTIAAIAAS